MAECRIVRLNHAWLVEHELLSTTWAGSAGKIVFAIALPGVTTDPWIGGLSAPFGWGDPIVDTPDNGWGSSAPNAVHALVIRLQDLPDGVNATLVQQLISIWANRVVGWLCLRLERPLGGYWRPHSDIVMRLSERWKLVADGPVGVGYVVGANDDEEEPEATYAQFADAVEHANRAEDPPLAHTFLLTALSAMYGEDLRRAVIDSATAAELAIVEAIRGRLHSEPLAAEALIKASNGVVALYEAAFRLGIEMPVSKGAVKDRIAGPRNDAAHDGLIPDGPRPWNSHQCAKQIVDKLVPLPGVDLAAPGALSRPEP